MGLADCRHEVTILATNLKFPGFYGRWVGCFGLSILTALLSSCGGKSSSHDTEGDAEITAPRGSDQDSVHLKGGLSLAGSETMSEHLVVMLYDHVNFSANLYSLEENGDFRFPLADFAEGHIYSLHVLTEDYLYLGAIRFAADPEPQTAMRFEGGKGVDLGAMVLSLDELGLGAMTMPVVSLGGGFAVYKGMTGVLEELVPPAELATFVRRQGLFLSDPKLIDKAFLQRPQDLAAQAVAEHTSLELKLGGREGLVLTSAAFEAGSRLLGALHYSGADERTNYSTAKPFYDVDYSLQEKDKVFSGRLYWGQYLFQKHLILLAVNILDDRTVTVPIIIANQIAMPQLPLAQSIDGGAWQDFSYADGEANGLSAALCLPTSNLKLSLSQPQKSNGDDFAAEGELTGQVSINYFEPIHNALVQQDIETTVLPLSFSVAEGEELILSLDHNILDPLGSGALTARVYFELWSHEGLASAVTLQVAACSP